MEIEFTEAENAALTELAKLKDMSEQAVIRQALRMYQMVATGLATLDVPQMPKLHNSLSTGSISLEEFVREWFEFDDWYKEAPPWVKNPNWQPSSDSELSAYEMWIDAADNEGQIRGKILTLVWQGPQSIVDLCKACGTIDLTVRVAQGLVRQGKLLQEGWLFSRPSFAQSPDPGTPHTL